MSDLLPLLFLWLAVMNVLTFALCGIDKRRAQRGRRRISERRLLSCAALGGSAGLWIGMALFRHKTRKRLFTVSAPLLCIVWAAIVILVAYYL